MVLQNSGLLFNLKLKQNPKLFNTNIMPSDNILHTDFIQIKGAKIHNLKNVDINIPRNKFLVITGLSGSGKSSLAFDTLYAEGQRRYVESLSSYARQFLGRMNKPEVDYIKGLPPAIAIEQKVNTRNPRSTVGTSTELYDYIKILFARIGKTYSPVTGKLVKRNNVSSVVDHVLEFAPNTKLMVLAPCTKNTDRTPEEQLNLLQQQGFTRVEYNGEVVQIDELHGKKISNCEKKLRILIDRMVVEHNDETSARLSDSIQTAFYEGQGTCIIKNMDTGEYAHFSNKFEADGITFEEPSVHLFSFNNPLGACPTCEGFGKVMGIDEDLVVPNSQLSLYEDAVVCWKGEKLSWYKQDFIEKAAKYKFPIHKPYKDLSPEQLDLLWNGNKEITGIFEFFKTLEADIYKIQNRVLLSRYRGKTNCPTCKGARLRKEAGYIKINKKSIHELVLMPIGELRQFFLQINLDKHDTAIAKRLLIEINNRLDFLYNVGLEYLTLNRLSSTLSGGESQRINLATSLGSSLVGSLYILDEPSIGLHPRDTHLLIKVLQQLKALGNTVIVVEHDEEIMRAADEIIDIGPLAGRLGGEVVFQGNMKEIAKIKNHQSLTIDYLTGKKSIEVPAMRRVWNHSIEIQGARENNLKNINVKIPLNVFTVVTGVSGSGKSSLIKTILYPALGNQLGQTSLLPGKHDKISGDVSKIGRIEFVDQNPIGKSSRSNPVTYVKAFDEIRKLFSEQHASVINNFKPAHFSFNVEGGRCEECQGDGFIKIDMQFMADVNLVCESCKGKRFKDEILDVVYQGKNIYEVLEMTVDEAITFFDSQTGNTNRKIVAKLKPLQDVGLGYIKLGQPSSTLSGGESQRIKLASFLGIDNPSLPTLFLFDEPTTGLHFEDIHKLLVSFQTLIAHGHTILTIEHNLDIIKCADWIIDMGPEGGNKGGEVVFEGTPEKMMGAKNSYTAKFLAQKLKK